MTKFRIIYFYFCSDPILTEKFYPKKFKNQLLTDFEKKNL